MVIAAAVNENSMDALIPETLELAAGVMIFDSENSAIPPQFITQDTANALIRNQCEVLLCGTIRNGPFFEAIAQEGITRYLAAGMSVRAAVPAMDGYQLPLICDYLGGPGCSDHGHDHGHDSCDGDCDCCEHH